MSPHPDDEVLGAGGLMRTWSELGHRVNVVSVTDGEAAFPSWTTLGAERRQELDQALRRLSPARIFTERLAIPDGAVKDHVAKLETLLASMCANHPTLVAPFECDGHPDHEAIARACLAVARRAALPIVRYPVWAWHHTQPSQLKHLSWGKFALTAECQAAKRTAIRCFVSQLAPPAPREPIVPSHVLDYFDRDYEAFLL